MSALQLHRVIFGEDSTHDYHTSWYICQRWRAAMRGERCTNWTALLRLTRLTSAGKIVTGIRVRKAPDLRRPGKAKGFAKVGVIGALSLERERRGSAGYRRRGCWTLSSFVDKVTSDKVQLVCDRRESGLQLCAPWPFRTKPVNHTQDEWVRGEVHTNSIESFWSLVKRGIIGTYHNVSKAYVPLYLNEFSFCFNNRKNPPCSPLWLRRVADHGSGRSAVLGLKYKNAPQDKRPHPRSATQRARKRPAPQGRTPKRRSSEKFKKALKPLMAQPTKAR